MSEAREIYKVQLSVDKKYIKADRCYIESNGTLSFVRDDTPGVSFAFAPGTWKKVELSTADRPDQEKGKE